MTLTADRRLIPVLFDARPKVIVAAGDTPAACALAQAVCGPAVDVAWLVFHPGTPATPARLTLLGAENASDTVPLAAPPSGPCVLAAHGECGRSELGALEDWWLRRGAQPAAVLDLAPATARETLYRALLSRVLSEHADSLDRQADLTGQVDALRQMTDRARKAVGGMQASFDRMPLAPRRPALQWPSGLATFRPGAVPLRQYLPARAEGLVAFDLYSPPSADGSPSGRGRLLVTLRARESEAVLGTWRIPYERLGRGWFRCAFPAASTEPVHELELIIAGETAHGHPPELALSAVEPWHELSAEQAGDCLGQALALLLWESIPGARVKATGPRGAAEYSLRAEDYARVRVTGAAKCPFFTVFPDGAGFRLHPAGPRPVTAVLRAACIAGTMELVAAVRISNEAARFPVEYALGLTDASADCPALPADPKTDPDVLGFSGWQPVPADGLPHVVSLSLECPLDVTADLHFATRMREGQDISFEWADWLEVRARRPCAFVALPDPDPRTGATE